MHEPTSETAEQVKLKLVTTDSPGGEEQSNLAVAMPEGKTRTTEQPEPGTSSSSTAAAGTSSVPTGSIKHTCKRSQHPAALHQILADPGASEEDWLAACYEMEKHPNYKTFGSKPSSNWSDLKKLLQACTVIALIGMSGVILAHNFTSHRPALVPGQRTLPPAQIAPVDDVDFGPFMANLQRQIKRNWYPPKSDITSKGMVVFKVAKNGDVSHIRIVKPGPSDAFERAELAAIGNASSSFGPLPEGSPKDVDIEFTFDYNVFDRAKK